jgi:hypothetical protein
MEVIPVANVQRSRSTAATPVEPKNPPLGQQSPTT